MDHCIVVLVICILLQECHRTSSGRVADATKNKADRLSAIKNIDLRSTLDYSDAVDALVAEMKTNTTLRDWAIERNRDMQQQAYKIPGLSLDCKIERSASKPTSVHRLRPSDIDAVATIGDSVVAGCGMFSTSALTIFRQYRGHAFTSGGEGPFEEFVSVPNILRKFNPSITGYSVGRGSSSGRYAHLNVAVIGDKTENVYDQSIVLEKRMKEYLGDKYASDWKLINVFIGANDACASCKDKQRYSPQQFIKNLQKGLDYLHKNIPRAFVNLIEVLDVSPVKRLKDQNRMCKVILGTFFCKCAAELSVDTVMRYSRDVQNRTEALVASGRYDTREDFTVVLQPFLKYTKPLESSPGVLDMSIFAYDCFHLSLKGHEYSSIALWNNMLEPVGRKATVWDPNGKLKCPSMAQPYLTTSQNS